MASASSSQDEARRLAAEGAPEGTLVWALEQTAGRGRLDRTWASGRAAGIWFSLVLRPALAPDAAAFLTLVAGVGIADGLLALGADAVRLKWPNDLVAHERKLGGILSEAVVRDARVESVALGIGINLTRPADPALNVSSIGLAQLLPGPIDAAAALAIMLQALEPRYDEFLSAGPAPIRARWLELSASIGAQVKARRPSGDVSGEAVDLDLDGSLVIATSAGTRIAVRSGEVTHLR
jgi:BirA family biotin operon repressor/biotin-[acetyl-CoA-carboxylase] ligase